MLHWDGVRIAPTSFLVQTQAVLAKLSIVRETERVILISWSNGFTLALSLCISEKFSM